MTGYKCSIVEYTSNNEGKDTLEYLTTCVAEKEYDQLLSNLWAVISKDFGDDTYDILKDVRLVGDR